MRSPKKNKSVCQSWVFLNCVACSNQKTLNLYHNFLKSIRNQDHNRIIIRHFLLQNGGKEYRQTPAPIKLSINKKTQDCVCVSHISYITIVISSEEIQFVQNKLSVTSKTFSNHLSSPARFLNCQAWNCHTNGSLFTPALNMSSWVITSFQVT